ncbi:MAG: TlpA family protein disulfide reductase, partial [Fimbriimonadales bacterium]
RADQLGGNHSMTGGLMHSTKRMLFTGVALLTLGVPLLQAIERKVLPSFQVVGPAGGAVSSLQLSQQPKWLIIYATTGCPACDRLLTAIQSWQSTQIRSRTVLLVGGDPALIPAYISQRQANDPAPLSAFSDVQGQAWQALSLSSSPAVIGIQAGKIEWSIGGVLNDPSALESAIKAWVDY